MSNPSSGFPQTNPTIFLRLRATDAQPRELAWNQFSQRYAPIITSFARRLGARPQDLDDVVQDVMLGFYLQSPRFVYDPSKGRFRRYLKTCTYRVLQKRLGREARLHGKSLDDIDPDEMAIEQAWNDVWEQQQFRRALDEVRDSIGHTKMFAAFELYVVLDEPAQAVADKIQMHLNSVYRAKEQITRLLQEKVAWMNEED